MQIEYLEPADGAYRPGACNISPREIARRRTFGTALVAGTVLFGAALVAVGAAPLARLLIVFPLWVGLISLEEARRRFCGGFAILGIRSAAGSDATERVTDSTDLAADRAAAVFMLLPI